MCLPDNFGSDVEEKATFSVVFKIRLEEKSQAKYSTVAERDGQKTPGWSKVWKETKWRSDDQATDVETQSSQENESLPKTSRHDTTRHERLLSQSEMWIHLVTPTYTSTAQTDQLILLDLQQFTLSESTVTLIR